MHDILKVENLTKKFKKKNFFSSDSEEIIAVRLGKFFSRARKNFSHSRTVRFRKIYYCKINFKGN